MTYTYIIIKVVISKFSQTQYKNEKGRENMKISGEQFYSKVNQLYDVYNGYKKIAEYTEKNMKKHNINTTETISILNRNYALEGMEPAIIYLTLKYMYEATRVDDSIQKNKNLDCSELNPEIYYTDIEIERYKDFKREKPQNENFPLIFEKVLKLADDHYETVMDIKQIADLYSKNLIRYNKKTQRNTIYKNGLEDHIYINKTSVKEIKEEIENDEYISTTITLNILKNGEEEYYYNEDNLDFILEKGFIDCSDGWHRSTSIIEVVRNNPNIKFNMNVFITNFTEEKAKRFIKQENKKNKMNKKYDKSLDTKKLSNLVVSELNESSKSELVNKITTNEDLIKKHRKLAEFTAISDAVEYNFQDRKKILNSKMDVDDVSSFLIKGFNALMGTYSDEFINKIKENKEYSVMNYQNTFVGYVALFSELYNEVDWKEKLYSIINKIDFSINNRDWEEINVKTKKSNVNKSDIKKISNYFINLV